MESVVVAETEQRVN